MHICTGICVENKNGMSFKTKQTNGMLTKYKLTSTCISQENYCYINVNELLKKH